MIALIQRATKASVEVDGKEISSIGNGLLILLGVTQTDTNEKAKSLAEKISLLRIFENEDKSFDKSILDIKEEILVVSQMTLYGDCDSGRRPDFVNVAKGEFAEGIYKYFVDELKKAGITVKEGQFGAMMDVSLINRGPATFIIER